MLAIDEYHMKTFIRFKKYNPQTDRDYVNITGENPGCTSYVGRVGGVSNKIHGVVNKSPTLRKAQLGFGRHNPNPPKRNPGRFTHRH